MAQPAADTPQFPANLLIHQSDINWHTFMRLYNHVSTITINWRTDLRCIKHATPEQIQNITHEYPAYPTVQSELHTILLGDGASLRVIVSDNAADKLAHVVIAYPRRRNGTRCIIICAFIQNTSTNYTGLVVTIGLSAIVGCFALPAIVAAAGVVSAAGAAAGAAAAATVPAGAAAAIASGTAATVATTAATSATVVGAGAATGAGVGGAGAWLIGGRVGVGCAAFLAKVAVDLGVSRNDVAIVAAIKQLQRDGLIRLADNKVILNDD